MTWLADPAAWPRLADALVRAGEAAIDTETYGQPDRTSPQHRTQVHCWSLGILTAKTSPRGFRRATGVALPRAALDCPELRAALGAIKLWAHNSPHDEHSLANMGLDLAIEDTLQWLRVACPGRRDYGLKAAEQWALGYPPREEFLDLVKYARTEVTARVRHEKGCICGKSPCRARVTSDWLDGDGVWRPHLRVTWKVFTPVAREVQDRYAVTDFVPGHPRWERWVRYSLADAVRGMELVDWLRNRKARACPYPWGSDVGQLQAGCRVLS